MRGEASQQEIFAANRARGAVQLSARRDGEVTRRALVSESGSLRVRFPGGAASHLQAVVINSAGGIAGGDQFTLDVAAKAGAHLSVTSAAAEKIYRSHGPASCIDVRLSAEAGAILHWLPQETILFDAAHVRRTIHAELADDANLVMCEMAMFGRTAMGEAVRTGAFADHWRVRRGGRLIFADNVRLDGDIATTLALPACAGAGMCVATLLIAPGNGAHVEAFRALPGDGDVEMAISHWNGIALMRFCSNNSAALRMQVMTALAACAEGAPRTWLQ